MTLKEFIEVCFDKSYSKFTFPMRLFYQFDNYFQKDDTGEFVVKNPSRFKFFFIDPMKASWEVNLENDGMTTEDFKQAMLDMVVGYEGNLMTDAEFATEFNNWESKVRSMQNG